MKKLMSLLALTLALPAPLAAGADPATTTLWFDQPAKSFHAALPLGNGRLGAMVFGGVDDERLVLNESSVWSGSREDANRPEAHQALPEIRRLLIEGRNVEAEKLVNEHFTCRGQGSAFARAANAPFGCYQVLGNLHFQFAGNTNTVEHYRRELDLATATARVTFRQGGVDWAREHFVSAPDEVIVSRFTASKPGAVSFTVALDRPERFTTTVAGANELLMTGTLNDGHGGPGLTYAARVRVLAKGGKVVAEQNTLRVSDADDVLVLVAAATDYRGFAGRQLTDPLGAKRARSNSKRVLSVVRSLTATL